MFIYQPSTNQSYRVVWYGGESTQLHFEKVLNSGEWKELDVRTLGNGISTGCKELHQEMVEYYNYGCFMEEDYR